MGKPPNAGPTGKFPRGKFSKSDDGEIQIVITSEDGKVKVDFGSPVLWIAMSYTQAIEFASLLKEKARAAQDEWRQNSN